MYHCYQLKETSGLPVSTTTINNDNNDNSDNDDTLTTKNTRVTMIFL